MLRRAADALLDLVLPPRCPACRDIVGEDRRFCLPCWQQLSFLTDPCCATCGLPFDVEMAAAARCGACVDTPPPYRRARAAFRYEGAVVPVLLGFKHAARTHLALLMAEQMLRLMPAGEADQLLVPIPLDTRRLRQRGYNQAGLLARALARLSGVPTTLSAMQRVKPTHSTAGLGRAARFRAAKGAFRADRTRVEGRRVVLVDDVMTTGATVNSAAAILVRSGAASVDVVTFARALPTERKEFITAAE